MTTYYIAPTTHPTTPGSDTTGNGSSATPWATLSKFNSKASNGDACICKNGTYSHVSVSLDKGCTVQAETVHGAIFDGGGGERVITMLDPTGLLSFTFDGIVITNCVNGNGNSKSLFNRIYSASSGRTIFRRLKIYSCSLNGAGIYFPRASTPAAITFDRCLIYNITSTGVVSLVVSNSNNNIVVEIYNCVVDSLRYWFQGTNNSEQVAFTIKNSIFRRSSADGVYKSGYVQPVAGTYENNCAYGFTTLPAGNNNITNDPLFVDAANANFNLRPTSPCLNNGVLV